MISLIIFALGLYIEMAGLLISDVPALLLLQ